MCTICSAADFLVIRCVLSFYIRCCLYLLCCFNCEWQKNLWKTARQADTGRQKTATNGPTIPRVWTNRLLNVILVWIQSYFTFFAIISHVLHTPVDCRSWSITDYFSFTNRFVALRHTAAAAAATATTHTAI